MSRVGHGTGVGDARTAAAWSRALLRGFLVFVWIAGIGVAAAVAVFVFADPRVSFGGALRIGALYLGPFHHVPVVLRGDLAVDLTRLPGSGLPSGGSVTVEVGVALLAVTLLAGWMLFRAGTASAAAAGDRAVVRALAGARVAVGYAVPVFVVASVVTFEETVGLGSFASGEIRISLALWQAFVFPLAIAGAAGAAGGLWSWVSSRTGRSIRGMLAGGWSMFLLALGLSFAGLLVAGGVQPDEPVASATPSTARYFRSAFEGGPGRGALVLSHHLAIVPNEAMWTLVPALGGCDVVRGSEDANLLCYRRFPRTIDLLTLVTEPDRPSPTAPAGYFLFLLVPAAAAIVGGRRAAIASDRHGGATVGVGAAAGVVFAVLVGAGCLLSAVTISYGSTTRSAAGNGYLWLGPDPISGALLALAWGVVGGALGAWAFDLRRSRVERPRPEGTGRR